MPIQWIVNGAQRSYFYSSDYSSPDDFASLLRVELEGEAQKRRKDRENPHKTSGKHPNNPISQYISSGASKAPTRAQPLTVGELMTKDVITIHPGDTAENAWQLMQRNQIRHIPVVDLKNHLIGMISDRDLIKNNRFQSKNPIQQYLSKEVLTAKQETRLDLAAGVMLKEKINSLPVVGAELELYGIFTTSDLLRAIWKHAPIELWI